MMATSPPLRREEPPSPGVRRPGSGEARPDRSRVWVVVPAYNEAPRLGESLNALCLRWPNVVVVDDGSTDGTTETARAHSVWLVRHPLNLGQGAALLTGIRFALRKSADFIITFDADGQHDVEDLDALVEPLVRGDADIAFGSRFLGSAVGMPRGRRLLLAAAILLTRALYGIPVTDAHNGLRAMTRKTAAALRMTTNRMEHASEILESVREQHLRWTEVPVTIRYTEESLSKGQRTTAAIPLFVRLLLEKLIR